MVLAIDAIDRRGLSNEMRHLLQPNKTKVICVICLYNSKRRFTCPSLLTRRNALVKSGCVVQVKNDEMRRQLQPKKTKVKLY